MIKKFDLQFFGLFSGSTKTQQVQKRDQQPEELNTLAKSLYEKILPGLQSFDSSSFNQANQISNEAIKQQSQLMSQLPTSLNTSNNIINKILSTTESGNIPSGLSNALNSSVNKELQGSMGNMLNGLAGRGVLNSSITSQGINNLSQQAANAFNKNYLSAYNSVLSGYGQALQGSQSNIASQLSAMNTLGAIPSQTQESAYAGIMPAFNFWKTWQSLENSKPETYDTVVTQSGPDLCITGDTLVSLKDGTKIPVSELKDNDEILAWDFENGRAVSAPLTGFFKNKGEKEHDVIRVKFEDGSSVGVVVEHLFFDLTAGKFAAVNAEKQNYIGHEFAKVNDKGEIIPVKVVEIVKDGTVTETYAPQPEKYWNYLTDGFISGNDGQLGFLNRFDFDVKAMKYDERRKNIDLLMYGRCGYILFKDIVSVKFFENNKLDEMTVAFGKGLTTAEYFRAYFRKFQRFLFDKCEYEVYTD